MKRKILASVLALCMILSTTAMAVSDFPDMPNDYSTEALDAAVQIGLLGGTDGKIMPNDCLTRAQMAAILVRAFGATKAANLTAYTDVQPGTWYYADLEKAVQMGVFKGAGNKMNPNAPITRQEAFVVLSRAFSLKASDSSILDKFADKASIAVWAKDGVAAMVASGFVKGDGTNLNPLANISRKDFAVTLYRMVKNYITEAGVVTELAEGTVMINVADVTLKNVTVKGDLIIGDGVGNGDITLDNVKVEGRTLVRGGGVNSFVVRGNSSLGTITVSKVDGNVRVAVEGNADVEVIFIDDGKDDVIIEGTVGKLEVSAETPVQLNKATIKEVSVSAPNANITVGTGTEVDTMTTTDTATNAKLVVAKGATITTMNAAGEGTEISGDGNVTNANVSGDNVRVDTNGTKTTVAEGTEGVTAGDQPIAGGTTTTTPGGSTGGGYTPPTPAALNTSVSVLPTVNQNDGNTADSQFNQDNVTVTKNGNTYTIAGILGKLKFFTSTAEGKGTHQWVGLVVDTGESSIIGVKYGDYEFVQADVDDAASVNVGAGKFVLWVKADELANKDKSFTLSKPGKTSVTITLKFETPEITLGAEKTTVDSIALPAVVSDVKTNKLGDNAGYNPYYGVAGNQIEAVRTAGGIALSYHLDSFAAFTDANYPNTRINVSLTSGAAGNAYLLVTDGTNTFDTIRTGYFGVSSGSPISSFSSVSSLTFFATEAGTYTMKLELVDVTDGAVLASDEITVTVTKIVDLSGTIETESSVFFAAFYNMADTKNVTFTAFAESTNKDNAAAATLSSADYKPKYYVEIGAYNGTDAPTSATINNTEYKSGDLYPMSIGNNNFLKLPVWEISDGKLYVALPYLCVETLPDTDTSIEIGGATYSVKLYNEEIGQLTVNGDPVVLGTKAGYRNEAAFNADTNTVTQTSEHFSHFVGIKLANGEAVVDGKNTYIFRKNLNDHSVGITTTEYTNDGITFLATYALYGKYDTTPVYSPIELTRNYRLAVPGKGVIDVHFVFNFVVSIDEMKTVLENAQQFEYTSSTPGSNAYTYNVTPVISNTEGLTVSYTGALSLFTGESLPTPATADLARYLGALWRYDSGKTVSTITFNDKAYTWNTAGDLKGSNWENNEITLVSAIVADIVSEIPATTPETDITFTRTITLNSTPVTLSFTITNA